MEEKERRVLFLEENLNTCQAYGMGRLVSSNKLLPQTTKIWNCFHQNLLHNIPTWCTCPIFPLRVEGFQILFAHSVFSAASARRSLRKKNVPPPLPYVPPPTWPAIGPRAHDTPCAEQLHHIPARDDVTAASTDQGEWQRVHLASPHRSWPGAAYAAQETRGDAVH